jgi:solute carrier family 25 S-adenosylmethionine transporter 26
MSDPAFTSSLVSGGCAGIAVDISLFPLDTIKTRLQSSQGFWKAGGFSRIYAGIGPAAVGSAPNAAIFFCTYDSVKKLAKSKGVADGTSLHMFASSLGEISACLVRVPVEIVKQRRQASVGNSSIGIIRNVLQTEGPRGLYRGYLTTVFREIPFSLIQFPLWEFLKKQVSVKTGSDPSPGQSSLCGAMAGGFAAAVTTPLDVAKTRIMLAPLGSPEASMGIFRMLKHVRAQNGPKGLFAGVVPRTAWITIGGAVFFGMYEKMISILER